MRSWETDATFGSDILGTGSAYGNLTGKVKTRQIGFIRQEDVRRKGGVADKGRSKARQASDKQTKRR